MKYVCILLWTISIGKWKQQYSQLQCINTSIEWLKIETNYLSMFIRMMRFLWQRCKIFVIRIHQKCWNPISLIFSRYFSFSRMLCWIFILFFVHRAQLLKEPKAEFVNEDYCAIVQLIEDFLNNMNLYIQTDTMLISGHRYILYSILFKR